MKKIVSVIAVIVILAGVGYVNTHYTRPNCRVMEVSGEVITVEDKGGNIWEFYGEGYRVGDRVNLKMYTNCTADFTDDEIISVK